MPFATADRTARNVPGDHFTPRRCRSTSASLSVRLAALFLVSCFLFLVSCFLFLVGHSFAGSKSAGRCAGSIGFATIGREVSASVPVPYFLNRVV